MKFDMMRIYLAKKKIIHTTGLYSIRENAQGQGGEDTGALGCALCSINLDVKHCSISP